MYMYSTCTLYETAARLAIPEIGPGGTVEDVWWTSGSAISGTCNRARVHPCMRHAVNASAHVQVMRLYS